MQRYDTYKDSGVKWLGEIPSHWDAARVKHLFIVSRGRVIAADQMNDEGEYPVYSSQTENNGCMGYISTYDYEGDVLTWTTDGAKAGTVFRRRGKFNCTNVCGVLTPITNNHLGYLYYAIYLAAYYNKRVDILGYKIMSNEMAELKFPLPPFKEQTAIASYLDTATAKIDAAIAQQQKMINLLNERKQIIINRAVTKGLNPNAKMKDSGVEWIGEVPEGWEVRKLKYLLRQITAPSSSLNKIGLENIESGTGKFVKTNSEYEGNGIQFEKGDILYGKLRPYLKKVFLAEESGNAVGDFFVFRPNDKVEGKYMQLVLLSQTLTDEINSSTYGAKMPRVSIDFMGGLNIPSPSLDEQKEIVETIHKNCKPIDDAISVANNQISLLQERKQIIINEVVTGKVKVG